MEIPYDYIRGLTDGEGCFTFCSVPAQDGSKVKIPAYILRMSVRDKNLIELVRNRLKLKNKVYTYDYPGKDGYNRQPQSVLIVRDFASLRNVIIPLFYNKLYGYKRIQFVAWIEKMGADPMVPKYYKLLYKIFKNGYFEEGAKKFE